MVNRRDIRFPSTTWTIIHRPAIIKHSSIRAPLLEAHAGSPPKSGGTTRARIGGSHETEGMKTDLQHNLLPVAILPGIPNTHRHTWKFSGSFIKRDVEASLNVAASGKEIAKCTGIICQSLTSGRLQRGGTISSNFVKSLYALKSRGRL